MFDGGTTDSVPHRTVDRLAGWKEERPDHREASNGGDRPRQALPSLSPDNRSEPSGRFAYEPFVTQEILKLDPGVADGLGSPSSGFPETALQERSNLGRCGSGKGCPIRLTAEDPGDRVGTALAAEGATRCQHLVHDAAERPDVGPLVHRSSTGLLGTHVSRRSNNRPGFGSGHRHGCCIRWVSLKCLRQPEVQHLDGPVLAHLDIRGLEVAMDHSGLVGRLQRLSDLLGNRQRLIQRDRPVPTRNSVREGTASGRRRSALPARGPQNPRHAVPANPDDCGRVWRDHRGRASSGGTLSAARIATIRRRDVRSDGANRRGAGPGRSCRRSAVVPPAEQADPCPARGARATRDSRPGTAGGGGAATARSTR